jgi:hypothetical protein
VASNGRAGSTPAWGTMEATKVAFLHQAYHLETFIKKMKSSKFIQPLKSEQHLIADLLERFK